MVRYTEVWGTTQFDLLGIKFSVDLDKMVSLNYSLALEKVKKTLHLWKWRPLTPIGRITVIKTFVLSKFVHLFTAIPSLSSEFFNELNTILFRYLWQEKPKLKEVLLLKIMIKVVLK